MFNLELSIAEWRKGMRAAGIETPAPLEELEGHLREDVEIQVRNGIDASRAFEIAVRNIGRSDSLGKEFGKIGSARRAMLRRFMDVLCIPLVASIVTLGAWTFYECEMSPLQQILGFTAIACILLTACGWRHVVRFLPVIPEKRHRNIIGICGVWGAILAWALICNFIAEHWLRGLSDDQMVLLALWSVFPMTILTVLGMGLSLDRGAREFLDMTGPKAAGS